MDAKVLEFLQKATEDELRELNRLVIDELAIHRQRKISINRNTIKAGESYRVEGIRGKHNGCMFTVEEVKRTRVVGRFDNSPFSSLVPISCLVVEE